MEQENKCDDELMMGVSRSRSDWAMKRMKHPRIESTDKKGKEEAKGDKTLSFFYLIKKDENEQRGKERKEGNRRNKMKRQNDIS
jgi:hypothetical protein